MDKNTSKWKRGLVLLFAVITLLGVSFLGSYTHTDAEKLFLTPVFEDSRGWDIYTLENGARKDVTTQELPGTRGTLYLSRVLDRELEETGYTVLELDGTGWQSSVFLDGELLYTVDPALDNRIGAVEFPEAYKGIQGVGEYARVSLPPDYAGKTLTIALGYGGEPDYKSMPMVRLSSEAIQTQTLVSDANRISMPAAAYMTAALLLLGLFLYDFYHGKKSFSILLLTAAAFLQALRTLLGFEFYFASHFSLSIPAADLLIPLCAGLPMLYLFANMKRWQKWYGWFLIVPLGLVAAFHLAAGFELFSFLSYYPYDTLLYISLLALVVFAVLEYRDRNTVYRLFTPAFFAVLAGILLVYLSFELTGNTDNNLVGVLRHPVTMSYLLLQHCGDILLILGGAVSLLLTIKRAADVQSELSVMTVKNELISENIQSIQKSSREIAEMRHDMLRHLHTMLDLCHEENSERLEAYLRELTQETEAILPVKVCEHPVVNALVTRALLKAEKADIRMDLHVEVPAGISITDNDLCTLLMNMLDNAIEAVSALSTNRQRRIELTMHVRGRYLFVETLNPCEKPLRMDGKSGLCVSDKGDGHGYGMKAMSDIAEKYSSILQIKLEQGTIMVRTALLMPQNNA